MIDINMKVDVSRAVYRSDRVGFVPNLNSTQMHWVEKFLTHNQPE